MSGQFIVIYRPHNRMMLETKHIGPFASHDDAYDFLGSLPAIGHHDGEGNSGVKYIEELISPTVNPAILTNFDDNENENPFHPESPEGREWEVMNGNVNYSNNDD